MDAHLIALIPAHAGIHGAVIQIESDYRRRGAMDPRLRGDERFELIIYKFKRMASHLIKAKDSGALHHKNPAILSA